MPLSRARGDHAGEYFGAAFTRRWQDKVRCGDSGHLEMKIHAIENGVDPASMG